MAFDGITTAALKEEFARTLTGARIVKIAQTGRNELMLTLKRAKESGDGGQIRLVLSADASLPLACLTAEARPSPEQAPAFCMLLRKYLANGRILEVVQPSLERVLRFVISHYDEMGDLRTYTLVIELMGKHSNIVLIDDGNTILDAIKHIPPTVSSVREVLPGRTYFLPDTLKKHDPLQVADVATLTRILSEKEDDIHGLLVGRLTGISPVTAEELCYRAHTDVTARGAALSYEEKKALADALYDMMEEVRGDRFSPRILYDNNRAVEYAAVPMRHLEDRDTVHAETYESMSEVVRIYYAQKSVSSRIRNKSADLRQQVSTILARYVRKYDQQMQEMKDTEKRDVYRLRGELLTAYAHEITQGTREASLTDYHTGREVRVPLDPTLSATENAAKNFARYTRMKRAREALSVLTKETEEDITHLKSIRMALDLATSEEELAEIRAELAASGYIREKASDRTKGTRKGVGKKAKGDAHTPKSEPLHYITSDGFDVYVGKNNTQNDALTFQAQGKYDWWFHAKGMAGAHVVLRAEGPDIPDRAFEEAAALAAWYSAGRENGKVEIDYTELKQVKKPAKAKPGFVVYYTNYSMVAEADISALREGGMSHDKRG